MGQTSAAPAPDWSAGPPTKTVLIAEYEAAQLILLQRAFGAAGYRTMAALDGHEALRLARLARPDLIVLDLLLPKKTGFELLPELAAHDRTRGIPVVVASALTSGLVRTPQVRQVFPKPYDPARLVDAAAQLVGPP